ncbi:MAG: RNA polymerase subunit sigma-24 [Chloroflexi bacterium HGW-Chloroflexi-10]|nr:MAG: RNA polymerase subunit sigma-24 [Chloroflexi bacterium HGW-Chloroflexi-10]
MIIADGSNLYETQLIFEATKGDLDAFNILVLKYQNLIYNHAYVMMGDRYTAEDITQVSLIKAFKNISGFRGGSFQAWLLKIETNVCYDEMRWAIRHPTIPLIPEDEDCGELESPVWLTDPNLSTQVIVERLELSRTLNRMLNELPAIYRNPMTLIDIHELDYSEAAVVLDIPIGTVKSRLARARFKMKEKMQNNFDIPRSLSSSNLRAVA